MLRISDIHRSELFRAALMCSVICLTTTTALWGQGPGDTWLLQISEKEKQLAHPNDPMWMKSNMWDIGYQRMNDRNMPVLELTNLQPAGGPDIDVFQMTIGDSRFHFANDYLGTFALLGNTTPGYTLTSTANGGDLLTVNIIKQGGGGLAPGEMVRFMIDLDVDAGFPDPPFFVHPDYRTVLFDINAGGGAAPIEVYGPDPNVAPGEEDNAQSSVVFSDDTTAGPVPFMDQVLSGAQALYYNNIFRPYGVMEPVDIFEIGGGTVIPEPSSALLGIMALLGGMWVSRRSQRGVRSA